MDKPDGKLTEAFTLRLSPQLYDDLKRLAHQQRRKLADYVRVVLEDHVDHEKKQRDDEP